MCENDNCARDTDCAFALAITNGYSLYSESVGYTKTVLTGECTRTIILHVTLTVFSHWL